MHVVLHIYDVDQSVFGKYDDFEPGLTMLSLALSSTLEYLINNYTSNTFLVYFRL